MCSANRDNEIELLAQKEDWNFTSADTQYLTHSIHRYSGKFIPQIANTVIRGISEEGDTIFDPYMGSGTSLLEAMRLNRRSVGVDLNPIAVLIAKAKLMRCDKNELLDFRDSFIDVLDSTLLDKPSLLSPYIANAITPSNEWRLEDPWNNKWYQPHVLKQLVEIYSLIDSIEDGRFKLLSQVAFSEILRRSSNANSRYPNVMFDRNCKEKPLPYSSFRDSFLSTLNAVIALQDSYNAPDYEPMIIEGNNTGLFDIPSDSFDAIVTHPPYVGAIPYAEYCCLSLNWFGYDHKALDMELTGGKRQRKDVVTRFECDYDAMFKESYRLLKADRYMFTLVGNPTVRGTVYNLEKSTIDIAVTNGFTHIATAYRAGINRRGNNMGSEALLFFRKS